MKNQRAIYIVIFVALFILLLRFVPKIAYGLGAITLLVLLFNARKKKG